MPPRSTPNLPFQSLCNQFPSIFNTIQSDETTHTRPSRGAKQRFVQSFEPVAQVFETVVWVFSDFIDGVLDFVRGDWAGDGGEGAVEGGKRRCLGYAGFAAGQRGRDEVAVVGERGGDEDIERRVGSMIAMIAS